MDKLIKSLEKYIKDPKKGLPEPVFLFLTRISPMINVDLLIKNSKGETLLTWRKKGEKYPAGWHVPGGIIRFKEKTENRIRKVAKIELGRDVFFKKKPLVIKEIFLNQINRSHFISILYLCRLKESLNPKLRKNKVFMQKYKMKWFSKCPKNIIRPHLMYKNFINKKFNKNA